MSEDKKSLIDLVPDSVDNAVKNITDKPTQNMGTTFADIWFLVFGGISQTAEKRKLKYSYALQEFEKELKDKIFKIPEDKLAEPDMQLIAPALEAAKFCVEKEELRKMFSDLISSLLNVDYYNYLHPSFPQILKQLSPFDANLLQMIHKNDYEKFYTIIEDNADNFYNFINHLSLSFSNLEILGLINQNKSNDYLEFNSNTNVFAPECIYEIITCTLYSEDSDILGKLKKYRNFFDTSYSILMYFGRIENHNNAFHFVALTPLGNKFLHCCSQKRTS